MKYFVPELALGPLLPPQTQLAEKFGGLPWGLPLNKWPICAGCGNPQSHLATFVHDVERLDLGKEGRTVLVFQCNHSPNETNCEMWDADSGANAVVFLDAPELSNGLIEPPMPGAMKEIEMRIIGWTEQHDLVTPELEPFFYKADKFWEFRQEHEAISDSIGGGAKLGSVPDWVQTAEDIAPPLRFAVQLNMYYHFPDPLPTADAVGATISRWNTAVSEYQVSEPADPDPFLRGQIYVSDLTLERYGSGFDVEAAEFGDGGTAYLFINPDPDTPQGMFMWQCG